MQKFKNLKCDEIELILKFIKNWYCLNSDEDITNPKLLSLLNGLTTEVKLPRTLYRAYSFDTKEDLSKFKKGMTTLISHPKKDYESWTASLAIAERYLPGSIRNEAKDKYGILISINREDFANNIKFTFEEVFSEEKDKKRFFHFCFKYLSSKILDRIKQKSFTNKDIEEFQYIIPGIVRVITEREYLLKELHKAKPLIIKETLPKD